MALKGNQPQLHKAVVETFAIKQAKDCDHNFHKTVTRHTASEHTVVGSPESRHTSGMWIPTVPGPTCKPVLIEA